MTLDLFDQQANSAPNLLPYDGEAIYYGKQFTQSEADALFQALIAAIPWEADKAVIMGKLIETKRKVAWYGDRPFPYRYSGTTKVALVWTEGLLMIKNRIEAFTGEKFNSCLLNLYHSGDEGMAYHSDGEQELRKNGAIASLSLGAERKFSFKHKKTKERKDIWLAHGSLLVMKGVTQQHWLHRLPPTKKVDSPRVNLTFRQINEASLPV